MSQDSWWVETTGGRPVFGPCVDREMALSVRTVIEEHEGRSDLWVRQSDREGWVVSGLDSPKVAMAGR